MISKNNIFNRPDKKPILWDAFFKDDEVKKDIVIFCHGYKGFKDWGAWDLVGEMFSKENFFFLKFNFSHNGGTVDDPIDFPDLDAFAENNYSKELDDLSDLLEFLHSEDFTYRTQIDLTSISLIGHSRGGGISIIKASEDPRIHNLITWASVSDYSVRFGTEEEREQWNLDGLKYVMNGRTKQQMPHHYQFYEDFLKHADRLSIENAAKSINIPFLIIHAKGDPSVNYREPR